VKSKLIALAIAGLAVLGPMAPGTLAVDPADPPNIVMIYMDDVSAMKGAAKRLWDDPTITPTITNTFVEKGIEFTNAIGETSLCCPARGSLLTGQHTINHGVTRNDGRLFNPGMHIGKALKDAGYATMFIGKYLNNVNQYSPADWARDGQGWTYLDVTNGRNGDFKKYWVHTKDGLIRYDTTHSTRMVAQRAVQRFSEVPDDQPIFAVLSIFNMHGPNVPLGEFRDDERCDGFPPYWTPNYNEADVSDKPPAIANLPLLPNPHGWPTVGYCREILGIDWLTKMVKDELAAEGRLDNTLLVFTADNGMSWGAHRSPQRKSLPYSTPLPMFFSYPARWGEEPRQIDNLVVNIDLAPTFCALAGPSCHLGPYPGGQSGPDGKNMLPLLDGSPPVQWRSSALENHFVGPDSEIPGFAGWRAIRTDDTHALGAWHYVEWGNGFKELYNLTNDPWELQNIAGSPPSATQAALAVELEALWQEGRPAQPDTRPDAVIGKSKSGVMYGSHMYGTDSSNATVTKYTDVPKTVKKLYHVQVINRNQDLSSFTFRGSSWGSPAMSVRYLKNGVDVTAAVTGAGYEIKNVRPGNNAPFTIEIKSVNAPRNAKRTALLTISNSDDSDEVDVVKAILAR
jgi:arylsulfatase A-like enzyme